MNAEIEVCCEKACEVYLEKFSDDILAVDSLRSENIYVRQALDAYKKCNHSELRLATISSLLETLVLFEQEKSTWGALIELGLLKVQTEVRNE